MVIGAFAQQWSGLPAVFNKPEGCWIALDRVRDPGNLGTIMRTADAVGAKGILLIDDCADPYSGEAVRASMGAIFNVALVQTKSSELIDMAGKWPGQIIGTALLASDDYREVSWQRPLILMMGNEQSGLPDPLINLCTQLVRLPMHGRSDSLNLAVATGICLYEMLRSSSATFHRT